MKLYAYEADSAKIARIVHGLSIPVSSIHELELTNAMHLKVFRREATAPEVKAALQLFQSDKETGVLFAPTLDWSLVFREATTLVTRFAARVGCRSLDVLHCATAVVLNATLFVTSDDRQRELAKRAGLHVSPNKSA